MTFKFGHPKVSPNSFRRKPMTFFSALIVALLTFSAIAQENQKLPNGQWAFYGEEFYNSLKVKHFERPLLAKILNSTHSSQAGKLDTISSNCSGTCYKHVSVGYEAARKIMFGELDKLQDAKGTYVLDVYCGKKFYFNNLEEVGSMHDRVNIEHTWPQSRFNGSFPKDVQKSDMHHLYLTDSQANSVRGNTPFGFLNLNEDRTGGEGCRESLMGLVSGHEVYTPPAQHRGNVARALFYFSMHYDLAISKNEENTLRKWHKEDPIDQAELLRHERITKHQKIRNPFVDHPEIVDMIQDF